MKDTLCLLPLFLSLATPVAAQVPAWGIGPFVRPDGVNPIISPDTNSVFACPMRGAPIHWEALHTFNPAAVVKDGQVYLLYRAEDDTGGTTIGTHTSRLGLSVSDDGLHFRRLPQPDLFPADDGQKDNEWTGGCEDPRLVESEDGTFVVMYTQWNHKAARLAVATSRDLIHWTKYGPVFPNREGVSKSGAIVCQLVDGRMKAVRIAGKYRMYWGDSTISCASSEDLIHWDAGRPVMRTRGNRFDSVLVESGPPPLLTDHGIVMLYNGKNDPAGGDPNLPQNTYAAGQALFDANDPNHLLARTEEPFYKPEAAFERSGQYAAGTTFVEGLVFFHGKWFLYYGCADSYVAVAVCPTR
ncbi:MAG: glycoside hydrolase family 130 protein [Verrucomicrobiota bacterium]|jgi:predicted GH43/DUF377 family glycosyl hydrolase